MLRRFMRQLALDYGGDSGQCGRSSSLRYTVFYEAER